MKTIIVAGGAGFLGNHLCRALIAQGNKVICVDNLFTGRAENIADLDPEQCAFIEQDICEPIRVDAVDEIYNLACPASPPAYQKDPIFTMRTNVLGTLNLLELAERCGARFLQASTSEVYGDPEEHPQKETYRGNVNPLGIRACYDEGKRAAESLCMDFSRKGLTVRIARIFNTYGPRMDPKDGRVVSNFIVQALADEPMTLYGDGMQTRSFCYVEDLIRGLMLLMESDVEGPVNLGNPVEFTMRELAENILKLTQSSSVIATEPLPQDDPRRRRPDISLAKERLGWEPTIHLEEGLRRTIEGFRG